MQLQATFTFTAIALIIMNPKAQAFKMRLTREKAIGIRVNAIRAKAEAWGAYRAGLKYRSPFARFQAS